MNPERDTIIIGGGLSGLTLAYLLQKKGIKTVILEGSDRLGGRIRTVSGPLGTPLELGATWFSDMHPNLLSLIEELGLTKFPQYSGGISLFQTKSFEPPQKFEIPEAETPSYRLAGGTEMLIRSLSERLSPGTVLLKSRVMAVRDNGDGLTVETQDGKQYSGDAVVSCLPPQLAAAQIEFSPALPAHISSILAGVHTWMAGSLKFTLEYEQPFWRTMGLSGMLYSHAGIITEMYDHTNFEENRFGFTGFLNPGAAGYAYEVRRELVLQQLSGLLEGEIPPPSAYIDKIWNDRFLTDDASAVLRPHQNNGHPALLVPYMNGKFHFCGSETASSSPGYMEGAVAAAKSVSERF